MAKILTEREVSEIMSQLSVEQRKFILENSKQSKKAKWLEVLAIFKGIDIQNTMTLEEVESYIDDWVLVDILDSGYGNKNYQCECGNPLRYQYIVMNKKKQMTFGFGKTCLSNHTNLSTELVKDILNGFHKIDLERDEILLKVFKGELFNLKPYLNLENIPQVIIEQVNLGLPLLNKQIYQLEEMKQEYDKRKCHERILDGLKSEARLAFEGFPKPVQQEMLRKMVNNEYIRNVPTGFQDDEIEWLLSLGLPLLEKHQRKIFTYYQKQKLEKEMQQQLELEEYYAPYREKNITRINSGIATHISPISVIDYQTLKERHSTTLKAIHAHQDRLSTGNKKEWERIISMIRQLKEGGEFDYSSFKLNINMICFQLHIERDYYLY
ncbi:hypothetical protein GCM10009865_22230 [Aeromicrobium ponti]|uniref:Uncharacterized protein n=1 Tax=Cytobacillus oceanisediminis TaxID=665099 RepID=A0A562JX14_9BACI|nr:hypothetical protein [Cytobacillus oceanisediminis]TWH87494.1 hypothetical protein IQ19_02449 [Cytobacillus oceanisediminis]